MQLTGVGSLGSQSEAYEQSVVQWLAVLQGIQGIQGIQGAIGVLDGNTENAAS